MEEKKTELQSETEEAAREVNTELNPDMTEATEDCREKACGKLREELKKADNKSFAKPVIEYLIKRCNEDNGLAQDVLQEHKAWKKCFDYVFNQAKEQAGGARCTAVNDDVVYEWAEDYYHKDDKAEEEKKAKEAAERKKKAEENRKKADEQKKASVEKDSTEKKTEKTNAQKNSKEIDGQMNLFSMLEM